MRNAIYGPTSRALSELFVGGVKYLSEAERDNSIELTQSRERSLVSK